VRIRLSESACWDLLVRMFPNGLDDPEIVEQLSRRGAGEQSSDECADLLGCCLWDVFSNSQEVFTTEGAVVNLGSFRSSAVFIADFRSRLRSNDSHPRASDYLDFYMGTFRLADEVDLGPAYDLIFSRMRSVELDWRYVHPRLYVMDLGELRDEVGAPEAYDPSEAIARQLERQQRETELAELRTSFDEAYRDSVEEARAGPPPATVQSYLRIYGRMPAGWPPSLDG
jgi:hypothetical protein